MIGKLQLDEQGQMRVEEIATALQARLRERENEIYPLTDLVVAVEGWLEACATELLLDGEEHLVSGSAAYAFGRRHLKDQLATIESIPVLAVVPAPNLPVAV